MAARGGLDLEEEAPSTGAATGSSDSCVAVVVKKRLENLKLEKDIRQEEYSIFKVPSNLKAVGGIAYIPQMVSIGRNLEDDDVAEIEKVNNLHLLHIILRSLLPSQSSNLPCISTDESKSRVMTHPVSMLRDYGVRFKKNNNSKYITDIVFDKGWLQIPRLVIDDSTRTILLNLMAFEQCCYWQCSNVATTFVSFMDDLINEPRDVMHLHRKGIIVHSLGSERAVAEMFNQVCREIAIRDDCTGSLSCELEKVNKFIHKKRHRWWASFRQEHLRHPWAIASVAGGALFLGLTIMATTYAMLAFHIYKS
ncbi:hypothetical protein AAC387_Pa10g1956 [Persea americana]